MTCFILVDEEEGPPLTLSAIGNPASQDPLDAGGSQSTVMTPVDTMVAIPATSRDPAAPSRAALAGGAFTSIAPSHTLRGGPGGEGASGV